MYRTVCTHNHPYLWRASSFNGIILDISQVVPDHPLKEGDYDSETGNGISIPCNPAFDIPQPPIHPPTNLDWCDPSPVAHSSDPIPDASPPSFANWLVYLPLKTVERVMHIVHPKSQQCTFVHQNGDMDDAHFKYYAWELAPYIPSTSGCRETTTIVMAMPPWTLTPTDLQCFSACKEARIWTP